MDARLWSPWVLLTVTAALGCGDESSAGTAGAGGAGGTTAHGGAPSGGGDGGGATAGGAATGGNGEGGAGGAGGMGGAVASACGELGVLFPAADWEASSPDAVGLDASSLDEAMSYYASASGDQGTEQALVVRCGRLVWHGSDIDNVHNVWSVTKSFTSTVLGLLVDDGLCTTTTLAQDYVAALEADYGAVTLGHFATMTSGYDGGGDQSDTPFSPTAPLFGPGSAFQYWDSAMNQFGNVLTRVAGQPVEQLFAERVADPIGIPAADWDWGDWGETGGYLVNGGAGNKSRGIEISARELARVGHLMLNRGVWADQSLVSGTWVDAATSVQVPAVVPSHTPGDDGPGVYGYNWWVNGVGPNAARRWPEAPPDCYAALGFNNNRMYVVPSWGIVIVRLGTDGNGPNDAETSTFLGLVGASIVR